MGYLSPFSKINFAYQENLSFQNSFSLQELSLQNHPEQVLLWLPSTPSPEKKVMPAIYPKQPFAVPHTCSDNGSVRQAK